MRRLIGMVLFGVGIILFFVSIGLHDLLVSPLLLLVASLICWRYYYRRLAMFFLVCAVLAIIDVDIWHLLMALILLYFGYRLLTNRSTSKSLELPSSKTNNDLEWGTFCGKSILGEVSLGDQQFELKDITISSAVCNVHIDLSRAIIPEGETTIIINGLVGQVQLYLPYDLDATVATSVLVGGNEVLGKQLVGLNNRLQATTKSYETAMRKVKISASLLGAEVHVRYL